MKNTSTVHEQISALADGHLRDEDVGQVVDAICSDNDLRATWRTYHLVGDVLRSGVHSACSDTSRFMAKLQQRIEAEPSRPTAFPSEFAPPVVHRTEAANEPVFRWKLVAGAASLAAAAAIGWNWVGGINAQPSAAQLAQQQPSQSAGSVLAAANASSQGPRMLTPMRVVVGKGNPQVMLRDPRLDQLLEAHQQAGGASQMPSGFLRNATFDGPSR
ncbi:RseA family anti-sigma factor [Variovorax defluvii]|uniref:RseA family anti-sigma factor n=1 Tax=Variovorax defluvii TaxID=913761 RepID=A0ABP8GQJ7_9BURK